MADKPADPSIDPNVEPDVDPSVDPELWPLVEGFPPVSLGADTLAPSRAAVAGMIVPPDPASHPDVAVETLHIPGTAQSPDLRCLLYRPREDRSSGALLHIHGGGFVLGAPDMDIDRNVALARATGAVILSVDYRLAPEHPHPAALDDCHAALIWLTRQSGALGIAPGCIGLIGESAGGGLAAALALAARERGPADLACQVLIAPMLAPPHASADGGEPHIGRHIWNRASNAFAWQAFLPEGADASFIPGLAEDLSGLPPAFLGVGDLDLFVLDNLAYAGRLLRSGTPTELHLYPGAIHGFDRMPGAAVARRFMADLVGFLRRHLG